MARRVGSGRDVSPGTAVFGPAVLGVAVLLVLGFAVEIAIPWSPDLQVLPLAIGTAATFIALVALARARSARARLDKTDDNVAALAGRLAALDARIAALGPDRRTDEPEPSEVANDVHGLTQLVRSLAEALAGHERELGRLRQAADAPPPAPHPIETPAAAAYPDAAAPPVPSFFSGGHLARIATEAAARRPRPPSTEPSPIVAALDPAFVDLHVQPVVSLPQRQTRLYEVYAVLRLSETESLVPDEFIPTLERLGHVARLDAIVIGKAAAFSRRLAAAGRPIAISCNVAHSSLSDRRFLDRIDEELAADPALATRLVLEVGERTWREIGATADAIAHLSARGVAFAIDQIRSTDLDPDALAARGARFVKIASSRLLEGDSAGASRLAALLSRHPLQLVARQVEDEGIVPELIELGIPLAQGFALGIPSPTDAVLTDGSPGGEGRARLPAARELRPAAGAEEAESLRSFLRRTG